MILIISGKYGIVKRQFHLESRKGKRKIQFKHLYSSLPESDFSALRPGKRHAPQKALPRLLRTEMPVPISAHDMSSFQLGFLQNGDSPVMLEIFGIQNTLPQQTVIKSLFFSDKSENPHARVTGVHKFLTLTPPLVLVDNHGADHQEMKPL